MKPLTAGKGIKWMPTGIAGRRRETIQHRNKRVVIENGEHKGKAGDGQFLKRGTCINI